MRKPDFFIVGAPRCGTTALYQYLRNHPNIFMPATKEPHFFSEDFPDHGNVRSMEQYLKLFEDSTENHLAVGEASVTYLCSSVALRTIQMFDRGAKIIAMLRNPVDMVRSLHSRLVFSFQEDEEDFEKAWRLQGVRRQGRRIPDGCTAPLFLQYAEMGKLGAQVERLLGIFPREQAKLVLFEDFSTSARETYEDVLHFLMVPSDGRQDFPLINEDRKHRVRWLGDFLRYPPPFVRKMVANLKRIVGIDRTGFGEILSNLNRGKNEPRGSFSRIARRTAGGISRGHSEAIEALGTRLGTLDGAPGQWKRLGRT